MISNSSYHIRRMKLCEYGMSAVGDICTLTAHTFIARFLLDDSDLEVSSDVKRFFENNSDIEFFDGHSDYLHFAWMGPI